MATGGGISEAERELMMSHLELKEAVLGGQSLLVGGVGRPPVCGFSELAISFERGL